MSDEPPITIAPLDHEAKEQLLKAVADRGYANGLKASAKLVEHLAEGAMRVVGTNALRDIVTILREKSAELDAKASASIKELQQRTDTT